MKRFLEPLFMGLACGVVVFLVIVALHTVLPSPGNIGIAATAGVFAGAMETFIVYRKRKNDLNGKSSIRTE